MKKILFLLAFVFGTVGVAHAELLKSSVDVRVSTSQLANGSTSVGIASDVRDYDDGNDDDDDKKSDVRMSSVNIDARGTRGWSDDEKSKFLLTVKNHAELKSDQDLENFAKGVMASDKHVGTVVTDDSHVAITYKLPAKFLGIFKTDIDAMTNVSFETKEKKKEPKEVTVRFPWYRMFYSLDSDVRADILKSAIEASVKADSSGNATSTANVSARNGRVVQLVSNILKNIRTAVEVKSETESTVQ